MESFRWVSLRIRYYLLAAQKFGFGYTTLRITEKKKKLTTKQTFNNSVVLFFSLTVRVYQTNFIYVAFDTLTEYSFFLTLIHKS